MCSQQGEVDFSETVEESRLVRGQTHMGTNLVTLSAHQAGDLAHRHLPMFGQS